jgi:hypothetical protein
MTTKTCAGCNLTKDISEYHTERRKGKADRPYSRCKECWNAYTRDRMRSPENRARAKAAYRAKCIRLGKGSLSKRYSEKTPEQRARAYQSVQAWRAKHPEQNAREARLSLQLRRSHAYRIAWPLICDHYGNKCLCCGFPRPTCFDHVIPMGKNGANLLTNGQPLCVSCNTGKGQMGDGCKDYRPDQGAWIAQLVALNPWLGEALPEGRWHLTSEGRKRAEWIASEAGRELVLPG